MASRILSRWLKWPSSDGSPQQDTSWQRDGSKPDWLVSRNRFKAGMLVPEDVASSVKDDSLIKDGIAQQNLDVAALRLMPNYTSTMGILPWRYGFPTRMPLHKSLLPNVLGDYKAIYLYAEVDYKFIRREFNRSRGDLYKTLEPGKSKPLPEGMRFIDCQSTLIKGIAVPNPDVEYVALSYVWGIPQAETITDTTNDDHNIPLTIRDTIVVVRQLGFRYLWVDKYCIEDDNKHKMIGQMGKIYQSAQVTIIAASGEDPSYGLPGVSRMCHMEHDGCNIVFQDPEAELKASYWSTRGWTYQEGALSSSWLVFTPTQWLFESNYQITPRRVLPWSPFSRYTSQKELYILGAINEYASRDLTYPSDSLRAFLGILENWQSPILSHLSGVPFGNTRYTNSRMALFLHGIFWGCRRANLVRVSSVPSWTWAGWRGFTEEDSPYGMFTLEESLHMYSEILDVRVRVHGGKRYNLRKYSKLIPIVNENNRNSDLVDIIEITGWSIELNLRQLAKFEVHWDSLEFRDQHERLVMLVVSWPTWSGADKRWRLLVLGKRPGADGFYHRLGIVVWHSPDGCVPKDVVIDGQCFARRNFTLV